MTVVKDKESFMQGISFAQDFIKNYLGMGCPADYIMGEQYFVDVVFIKQMRKALAEYLPERLDREIYSEDIKFSHALK